MDNTVLFDFACVDHGPVQFKEIRPYARANAHKLSGGRFRWWRLSKLQLSASTDSTSTTNIFYSGDVPQLLESRKIALIGQQLNYNPGFEDTGHQLLFESLIPAEHGEFKVSEFLLIPEVLPFMDDDDGVDSAASVQRNFAHDESVTNLSHRAQRIASIRRPCDSEALLLCGEDAVAQTSISISCVTPKIWRVEYFVAGSAVQDDVEGVAQSKAFKSFAVAESSLEWPNSNNKLILAERELNSGKQAIFLSADQENSDDPCIEVAVDKEESHISFFSAHKQTQEVIQSEGIHGVSWESDGRALLTFAFPSDESDDEALIYGLGERSLLRKNGHKWIMWNTDAFGYEQGSDPLYQCYPLALVMRPKRNLYHALFFDNHCHAVWDFCKPNQLTIRADHGTWPLRYYVIGGATPQEVLSNYTLLTGRHPLPPTWALGYQQCRWSYYPESRVKRLAEDFREKDIPCDVIWLDIDYMDGFRCFTWDANRFPDSKKLCDFLHDKGFKVISMIDPGIKAEVGYWVYDELVQGGHYCRDREGEIFNGVVWPGKCAFPDYTQEHTRKWWGTLYKGLVQNDGVDGIWNDMNEPAVFRIKGNTMPISVQHSIGPHHYVHNVYGMLMAKATFEGLQKLQHDKRPFLLTRAGYCGVQRYAWMWTGDNKSTWNDLKMSIPICLGMGLSGVAGCGVDIGGFALSPTPELFGRWIQLGAFLPLSRTHSMKDTDDQEPWSFGKEIEDIARKYIKLRYRLLPYWYTYMWEACTTGIPVMRPLWMAFPQDPNTWLQKWEETEFLIGPSILVAPILEEGSRGRQVYLPCTPGCSTSWYDFYTKKAYPGGQVITVEASLDVMPLFVLGGSVVPMRKTAAHNVQETSAQEMEFVAFGENEEECRGLLYVDDGSSLAYQRGQYALYSISSTGPLRLVSGTACPLHSA